MVSIQKMFFGRKTAISNHFAAFKKCVTEIRTCVKKKAQPSKSLCSNGFLVKTP